LDAELAVLIAGNNNFVQYLESENAAAVSQNWTLEFGVVSRSLSIWDRSRTLLLLTIIDEDVDIWRFWFPIAAEKL
jgi:hypothetical protein